MTETTEIYQAIATREKASRREAERLLDFKSRELFEKNSALEETVNSFKEVSSVMREIMHAAPDGIITCNDQFEIVSCNPAAADLLGARARKLQDRPLDEFFPGLTQTLTDSTEDVFVFERHNTRRKDGREFPAELRGRVGAIAAGVGCVILVRDISERINAEERRRRVSEQVDESRRLEAIGALSAGIAHEINTPIQFIGDNLEFLLESLMSIHESYTHYEKLRVAAADRSDYAEELKAISEFNGSIGLQDLIAEIAEAVTDSRDGIRQVRDIILVMKEFSHKGTGKKHEVDLNAMATNVITICRKRSLGVADLELELDEGLPLVRCRRSQLQQVLLNLVVNAIDVLDEGKRTDGRIRISTSYDDEFISCAVSDNGSGVPVHIKEKIFDPFFTTKPVGKGTGQGLALAKEYIVKGHDGRLSLIDAPGFATTFLIQLPRRAIEGDASEGDAHDTAA